MSAVTAEPIASNRSESHSQRSKWKLVAAGVIVAGLVIGSRVLPFVVWLKAFNEWTTGLGSLGIAIFIVACVTRLARRALSKRKTRLIGPQTDGARSQATRREWTSLGFRSFAQKEQ